MERENFNAMYKGEDLDEGARMRAGYIPHKQTKSLNDYLIDAAGKGDADEIRRLVAAGADVNVADCLQKTPMHFAAIRSHVEALKALKELGGNHDARAMGNKRPLDWVGKPGHGNKADDEAARALLESWASAAA